MKPTPHEPQLWLTDGRGQYLPRDFARSFTNRAKHVTGVSDEDWAILEAGPDHDDYYEAWDEVLSSAIVTTDDGVQHVVYQDGDCWLVPVGMEWDHDADWFSWQKEQADEETV